MPKAFSELEKQMIRQSLIDQGQKQFAQFGLQKSLVEEIASAAGISKGAFYHFYPSKEALFMEAIETAERQFRQDVLATVTQPGPSPQARLYAVLQRAFTLWKTIPILRGFTQADYAVLARRVPAETLHAHLHSDRDFADELVAACRATAIPIVILPAQVDDLLHTLFFASLHEDDLGAGKLTQALETLLRLTAAYCLGEIVFEHALPTEALPTEIVSNHEKSN